MSEQKQRLVILIDEDLKEDFRSLCEDLDTTMSNQSLRLIRSWVDTETFRAKAQRAINKELSRKNVTNVEEIVIPENLVTSQKIDNLSIQEAFTCVAIAAAFADFDASYTEVMRIPKLLMQLDIFKGIHDESSINALLQKMLDLYSDFIEKGGSKIVFARKVIARIPYELKDRAIDIAESLVKDDSIVTTEERIFLSMFS